MARMTDEDVEQYQARHRRRESSGHEDRLWEHAAALEADLAKERAAREQAERELGLWRAETGARKPEDAGAAIRHTREDLRQAELELDEARSEAAAAYIAGKADASAALLEQMRALEEAATRACDDWEADESPSYSHAFPGLMAALRDVLKVTP